MKLSHVLIALVFTVCVLPQASAQISNFRQKNPDVFKYEFARSYVSVLGHLNSIDQRWQDPKLPELEETERVKRYIQNLTMDNNDLRVARNYLKKYSFGPNAVMKKVADDFFSASEEVLAINAQERKTWEQMYGKLKEGELPAEEHQDFLDQQEKFSLQKKKVSEQFIETALWATKALLSEEAEEKKDKRFQLALTRKQKDRLVKKLDSFARDNYDWGMKEGQTIPEACIATFREILEDPVWETVDQ